MLYFKYNKNVDFGLLIKNIDKILRLYQHENYFEIKNGNNIIFMINGVILIEMEVEETLQISL